MKVKVSELSGAALDWAVAKCEGLGDYYLKWWNVGGDRRFTHCTIICGYSTFWSEGGPIIERELVDVCYCFAGHSWQAERYLRDESAVAYGPTPLTAAMRCYVASKLGDEVEIPKELV